MKIQVDPSRFRLKPYAHQLKGVTTLLLRPNYGLFWKMRLGKTKAIIDTACVLFEHKLIDTLLVVGPAQVKDVWIDKTLGEIKTHDWSRARVYNYKEYGTLFLPDGVPCYVASSVEFLRQQGPRNNFPMVDDLLAALAGRRVWFVFDEGSVLGNHDSLQTKAMIELRYASPIKRFTLLDGTPRGNSHLSFWSKFRLIDKDILGAPRLNENGLVVDRGCQSFYHFRAKYSEIVKVPHKWETDKKTGEKKPVKSHVEVVAERNTDEFVRRTADHCEYLDNALDMPTKIPGVLPVALDEKNWRVYCEMRDALVAEIDEGICQVQHAAVKVIRLAQICAGFVGGVNEYIQPSLLQGAPMAGFGQVITKEIHDIPTKMLIEWLKIRFAERSDFKVVIWSRFVPEIERLLKRLDDRKKIGADYTLAAMYGEVKTNAEFLHPSHNYSGPVILVAQAQAVRYGKNYSKADTSVYLSQDYDRVTRSQSEDRIQAPHVRKSSSLLDVIVTGPKGQKTIVHDIVSSVRNKEEAEKHTAQGWKKVLLEE